MSIFTGKDGYDSARMWRDRSATELLRRDSLYEFDFGSDKDSPGADPAVDWVRGKLAQYSAPPDVLEIGSGFGKWAEALNGLYATFTGVDVIEERVAHATATRGGTHVHFQHIKPGWNLGRTFPVILCITVIQHLAVPQAVDVVRGIERHLAPGGAAFIAEQRILDVTVVEAERLYADPAVSVHMIPKPLSILKDAAPGLQWRAEEINKFVVTKI